MSNQSLVRVDRIGSLIQTIRGKKVILDADLARIYGVPTRVLNQALKRNLSRFPEDFIFQLTAKEAADQMRSQTVIASKRNVRYLPYAFTEKGAVMTANILNSPDAVRMSIFVVRAFIEMRELLGGTKELARQLAALEKNSPRDSTDMKSRSWKCCGA